MCDISSDPSMHDPPVSTKTRVTCEAWTGRKQRATFGFNPIHCGQSVGLRGFLDARGQRRYACSASGHETNVRRRFGTWQS